MPDAFLLFGSKSHHPRPRPFCLKDGVEEVQLVDSFQRILQEKGLSDEHTPQELRFQARRFRLLHDDCTHDAFCVFIPLRPSARHQ